MPILKAIFLKANTAQKKLRYGTKAYMSFWKGKITNSSSIFVVRSLTADIRLFNLEKKKRIGFCSRQKNNNQKCSKYMELK